MKKRCNNKGFSLVELIIVIAIMAILIGVMAPQLIRYIEKAKVSNDTQIADTLHSAITYALADPEVLSANDNSSYWVNMFTTPPDLMGGISPWIRLWDDGSYDTTDCKFLQAVTEIVGYNPWLTDPTDMGFKSTPNPSFDAPRPVAILNDTGTAFGVYLNGTDRTGHKNGEMAALYYDELSEDDHVVIYVK